MTRTFLASLCLVAVVLTGGICGDEPKAAEKTAGLKSMPVEKDGLSIVIESGRESYNEDEEWDVRVVLANVSKEKFHLFDPFFVSQQLTLLIEETDSGKKWTGRIHGDPRVRRKRIIHPLAPDDAMSVGFNLRPLPQEGIVGKRIEFTSGDKSLPRLPAGNYRVRAQYAVEPEGVKGYPDFDVWSGTIRSSRITLKVGRIKDEAASALTDESATADGASAAASYSSLPPTGFQLLAEHRTIARYAGAPFITCRGTTGGCPDRCGGSGEFATFEITHYLHYEKKGQYGDDRQQQFMVRISDFYKKPVGDEKLRDYVASLKPGDVVLLEWNHYYGEVHPGSFAPTRPILHLRKLSASEAERIKLGEKTSDAK